MVGWFRVRFIKNKKQAERLLQHVDTVYFPTIFGQLDAVRLKVSKHVNLRWIHDKHTRLILRTEEDTIFNLLHSLIRNVCLEGSRYTPKNNQIIPLVGGELCDCVFDISGLSSNVDGIVGRTEDQVSGQGRLSSVSGGFPPPVDVSYVRWLISDPEHISLPGIEVSPIES